MGFGMNVAVLPHLRAHVLDDVLVPHGPVGHGHERAEHHGQLALTGGRHLVVEDLDGDAQLLEGQRHLGADVVWVSMGDTGK
jgi:hypothetical protein